MTPSETEADPMSDNRYCCLGDCWAGKQGRRIGGLLVFSLIVAALLLLGSCSGHNGAGVPGTGDPMTPNREQPTVPQQDG